MDILQPGDLDSLERQGLVKFPDAPKPKKRGGYQIRKFEPGHSDNDWDKVDPWTPQIS